MKITLLPGEDIPLRIFEPRYKQLIEECYEEQNNFGIPFIRDSDIQTFGIECKVEQIVAKNSRGEMVITVMGLANFEIKTYQDPLPGKLYSGGKIILLSNERPVKTEELLKMLNFYTDTLDPDFLKFVKGNSILVNDVARAMNLSSDDKFNFISLNDHEKQENFLRAQMKYLIHLRKQEKLLNDDYYLN